MGRDCFLLRVRSLVTHLLGLVGAWLVSVGHGKISAGAVLCAIHDQVMLLHLLVCLLQCFVIVSYCSVYIVVVAMAPCCPMWDICCIVYPLSYLKFDQRGPKETAAISECEVTFTQQKLDN